MEFILIILSSLLFTIPHYFPALFFLSWFAFIPLIYLIKDYDYSHSFIIALLIGFLNSAISFYWIYQPLSKTLKMPFSFIFYILLCHLEFGLLSIYFCSPNILIVLLLPLSAGVCWNIFVLNF